jgi:hypothetical protein
VVKEWALRKKRKDGSAQIESADEIPEPPLQYDNSGYSESDIKAALENAKILLGLGFSENEINEAYSQEDLAEILNNNYTKEKWLEISRARFTQKDKKSEEQKTKNENAFFVGEKENKKTIQAKIRILKHDIKLIQFEIAKNKNELKDTSLLDKRLKKLENELAEKQSILDFYDAGLTNEEINKLSDVRNYVNHKKETYTQDQYLKKKGFSQEDINVLTDGERSDILRTGLLKKDFVVDYEDGEYSSGAKIKKIEQGLIALRTAFKYAKTEEDKNAISKKINNAETTISLLKRGFNNSEINRMSEGEIAQI